MTGSPACIRDGFAEMSTRRKSLNLQLQSTCKACTAVKLQIALTEVLLTPITIGLLLFSEMPIATRRKCKSLTYLATTSSSAELL